MDRRGRGKGGSTSELAPANRRTRQQRRSAWGDVWRCILLLLRMLEWRLGSTLRGFSSRRRLQRTDLMKFERYAGARCLHMYTRTERSKSKNCTYIIPSRSTSDDIVTPRSHSHISITSSNQQHSLEVSHCEFPEKAAHRWLFFPSLNLSSPLGRYIIFMLISAELSMTIADIALKKAISRGLDRCPKVCPWSPLVLTP